MPPAERVPAAQSRLEALTQRLMALNSGMGTGDEPADASQGAPQACADPGAAAATDAAAPGAPSQEPLPQSRGAAGYENPFAADSGAASNPFLGPPGDPSPGAKSVAQGASQPAPGAGGAHPVSPNPNTLNQACLAAAREAAAAPAAADARGRHVSLGGARRGGPSMASSRAAAAAPARPRAQPISATGGSRFQGFDA